MKQKQQQTANEKAQTVLTILNALKVHNACAPRKIKNSRI